MADPLHNGPSPGAYDGRLVRRLWVFVRPYRAIFGMALLLSPLNQVFSLWQPYLLKVGIDQYVQAKDLAGLWWLAH